MRHRKAGVKLSRTSSHRDAMFRNMVTSLIKYERIKTTDVKAKELKRLADRMITLGKRGDLHAQRQAHAIIREKDVVYKLFSEIAPRFKDVEGGYTRTVRIDCRDGDAAPMMLIELSVLGEKVTDKKKTKKDKSAKKDSTQKGTEAASTAQTAETISEAPKIAATEPTFSTSPQGDVEKPEASPDKA